ncbi:MAG: hypothetical protein ACK559_27765, partial [bacterium]
MLYFAAVVEVHVAAHEPRPDADGGRAPPAIGAVLDDVPRDRADLRDRRLGQLADELPLDAEAEAGALHQHEQRLGEDGGAVGGREGTVSGDEAGRQHEGVVVLDNKAPHGLHGVLDDLPRAEVAAGARVEALAEAEERRGG